MGTLIFASWDEDFRNVKGRNRCYVFENATEMYLANSLDRVLLVLKARSAACTMW